MATPGRAWDPVGLARSPWFASVRDVLAALPTARFPDLDDLNALARKRCVVSGGGQALRFVAASSAAGERQYESHVHCTGEVATRSGSWHDLFNALVWLTFPRTKAALNTVHHAEIERRRGESRSTRGAARDIATLFDEGGILAVCSDASLAELVRTFRWRALFWERRADVVSRMRFHVFGHAILEHALAPHKGVTAKALLIAVDEGALQLPSAQLAPLLDAHAAAHFARCHTLISTHSLHPLPVTGIPGWARDNEMPSYYDDPAVFRPGRTRGK